MQGHPTIVNVPGLATQSAEFVLELWRMCNRNGWSVDGIATHISKESGFQASAKNPHSSAAGLLQWIDSTAQSLYGISSDDITRIPAIDQLPMVETFFKRSLGKKIPRNIADYALAGWGRADLINQVDEDYILVRSPEKAYGANASSDRGNKGYITLADRRAIFWRVYDRAHGKRIAVTSITSPIVRMQPVPPGIYWVDIPANKSWTPGLGVQVLRQEENPEITFVLFSIDGPNVWYDGPGFPTVAPAGEGTTVQEISTREPRENPITGIMESVQRAGAAIEETAATTTRGLGYIALGVAAACGLIVVSQTWKGAR